MKPIYDFIDFRKYLEHYYQEKKKVTRHFSFRYFAQKAGIGSPSFLKHVIDGKRNLTGPVIEKFCKALSLNTKESTYFRNLVLFNQAKTSGEKQEHYAVLRSLSSAVKEKVLRGKEFDYFNKWYNAIIREFICIYDFQDDYEKLGKALIPPISASEAKKSIQLLQDLDLVKKKPDGTYIQTDSAVLADDTITSMAVRSFTERMLQHAQNALHNIDKSIRHISGMTMGISPAAYDIIAAEIDAFKDRIKTIVARDEDSSRVYQLNLTLFPLSKDPAESKTKKESQNE